MGFLLKVCLVWGFFWGGVCSFVFEENYFALMENVGPELQEIREMVAKPDPLHGSLPSC